MKFTKRRRSRTVVLNEAIWNLLARLVPDEAIRLYRIQENWSAIATDRIAAHTWPVLVRRERLFIDVANNQWLHEFGYFRIPLLERLHSIVQNNKIEELRTRIGEVPPMANRNSMGPEPQMRIQESRMDTEPPRTTVEALMAIKDPELRDSMAAARLVLGRPKSYWPRDGD